MFKPIDEHFNSAHIGVEILSMSKRIMFEVMTTAEDNNLFMCYTDTDSLHIKYNDIPILEKKYNVSALVPAIYHLLFESCCLYKSFWDVQSDTLAHKDIVKSPVPKSNAALSDIRTPSAVPSNQANWL